MAPIDQAQELYNGAARNFGADLVAHLERGYVYSSPSEFIMARTVRRREAGRWNDLTYAATAGEADCWLIWLAVGPKGAALRRFLDLAPVRLPWLAWHRQGNKLRVWSTADFERRVQPRMDTNQHELKGMIYG